MDRFSCTGCTRKWTRRSDLLQHFGKTQTASCLLAKQEYERSIRKTPSLPRRNPSKRPHSPKTATESAPQTPPITAEDIPDANTLVFNGDNFGSAETYTTDDFPGFGETETREDPPESDEEHDSDESDGEGEPEPIWEPRRMTVTVEDVADEDDEDAAMDVDVEEEENEAGAHLPASENIQGAFADQARRAKVFISHFGKQAGEVISEKNRAETGFEEYERRIPHEDGKRPDLYAPFGSKLEWEIAQWAKLDGPSASSLTRLLGIDGVSGLLGLNYKTAAELNAIIDKKLPNQRPQFFREEVIVAGESFDLYRRDIIECIRSLYGDPTHAEYLCFTPERHYSDEDETIRLYHDFHTGRWWWDTQAAVEANTPGATIIPIILSSDKTQVTLFRNKTAYPVYLTIGNLPKDIRKKPSRHGQVLLAYLPTTKLDHIKNKTGRRRALANLFHACLKRVTDGLKQAGMSGLVMHSGDGIARRCHPIFAAYVGDYPEQVLVTCTYNGDSPVCQAPNDDLGEFPCAYAYRDFERARDAVNSIGTSEWGKRCADESIKPVQHPFWADLPYVDVFRSITPNILHQLLQGVMKHLIGWITVIVGAAELDARVRRLPPNHCIRIFHKGLSTLSRVSGTEHKQICAFLLSLIVDLSLPIESVKALMRATRSLLDFLYLSRYPVHSDETLAELDAALAEFHENKWVFVKHGARKHFNFPKLHFLNHYVRPIRLFGTADNYNTETTERLHIDFAKDAYRATNRKDEYAQMTKWLERREKMVDHAHYLAWRHRPPQVVPNRQELAEGHIRVSFADLLCPFTPKMTNWPSVKSLKLTTLASSTIGHGASLFIPALTRFIVQYNNPMATPAQIEEGSHNIALPFRAVPIYHRIKFVNVDFTGNETLDSIHAYPRLIKNGRVTRSSRFDTALIHVRDATENGGVFDGLRVGRVRAVFSLPEDSHVSLFPANVDIPKHLAYVEWFTRFSPIREENSKMYHIRREITGDGTPLVSVVPLALIQCSVHLYPKWGKAVPEDWTSENILDKARGFTLSNYRDQRSFFRYH